MKIKVKVKPNAGEQGVEKLDEKLFHEEGFDGMYYVKVKSGAEGNKANIELLKLLTRYFNTTGVYPDKSPLKISTKGKEVKIKAGFTSRVKIVEVLD